MMIWWECYMYLDWNIICTESIKHEDQHTERAHRDRDDDMFSSPATPKGLIAYRGMTQGIDGGK